MELQLNLTCSDAHAGVDQQALIADVQAEVKKLEPYLTETPKQVSLPPPRDAQGGLQVIQWLLHVASDPKMAVVYARAFIFAINKILESRTEKIATGQKGKGLQKKKRPTPITIKALGKELVLPTTSALIEEFLKSLQS
jgi:hypothetical protein